MGVGDVRGMKDEDDITENKIITLQGSEWNWSFNHYSRLESNEPKFVSLWHHISIHTLKSHFAKEKSTEGRANHD